MVAFLDMLRGSTAPPTPTMPTGVGSMPNAQGPSPDVLSAILAMLSRGEAGMGGCEPTFKCGTKNCGSVDAGCGNVLDCNYTDTGLLVTCASEGAPPMEGDPAAGRERAEGAGVAKAAVGSRTALEPASHYRRRHMSTIFTPTRQHCSIPRAVASRYAGHTSYDLDELESIGNLALARAIRYSPSSFPNQSAAFQCA